MAQIEFENVFYCSEGKEILKDVSITVGAGDYISIVGASGSGKSTFLKLCCHLISPSEGRILVDGRDILEQDPTELRKKIGYCFQTPVLFGDTVKDNLAFPYSIRGLQSDRERIDDLFDRFQIRKDIIDENIQNLSGGEKQRIALIRTLLFRPEILLLDEVTSALDTDNTHIVEEVIESLNGEGVTILWVTHNPEQSRKYSRKLLTIDEGRIQSLEVLR